MNQLRGWLIAWSAGGSVEELAGCLERIAARFPHPQNSGAGQHFPHQVGSTKDDDTNLCNNGSSRFWQPAGRYWRKRLVQVRFALSSAEWAFLLWIADGRSSQ